VIEAEAVHPTFVDQMVHRGRVVRVRAWRKVRRHFARQSNPLEMTEHDPRPCPGSSQAGGNRQLAREEAAGARRVDHEVGVDGDLRAVTTRPKFDAVVADVGVGHLDAIAVIDAGIDRLANEVMIDVGA